MACGISGILQAIFNKRAQVERRRRFLENGSMLLEDLIAFSNGRYDIPIRRFSVDELSQATNGFCSDGIGMVIKRGWCTIYKGSFEERLIFIKKYPDSMSDKSGSIRDLVMMAVMSSHKNVLKVIGYCLDFELPALVFECAAAGTYSSSSIRKLSSLLYGSEEEGMAVEEINGSKLNWKSRVKIANEIANVVLYMHTAFPTPIIHRDLKPGNIIIDQCGVAKLSDFSFSISIPPGETEVETERGGTYEFMAPEYLIRGIATVKSDIYSFGMILFELLTGERAFEVCKLLTGKRALEQRKPMFRNFAAESSDESSDDDSSNESTNKRPRDFGDETCEFLYDIFNTDQLNNVVDPTILQGEGGGGEIDGQDQQQQFQDFAALALRCVKENSEDRPEMIDVAKELRRMLKSVCPSS